MGQSVGQGQKHWGSVILGTCPHLQVPVPTVPAPRWVSSGKSRVPSRHRRAAQALSCGGRAAPTPGRRFSAGGGPSQPPDPVPAPSPAAGGGRAGTAAALHCSPAPAPLPAWVFFFFFSHSFCNFFPSSLQVAAAAGEEPSGRRCGWEGSSNPRNPHRTPKPCWASPAEDSLPFFNFPLYSCLVWSCSPPTPTAPVPPEPRSQVRDIKK